jgi:ABC-2 type transport system ATP-binding protein
MPPAIETHALRKSYGRTLAVDDLSLRVEPGEIYGFLGLNGAGKTTTIRMLLGMISPEAGDALVLGQTVRSGRGPWESVGYLVENPTAYSSLSVRENLEAVRRLRPGLPEEAVDRAMARFGITRYASRRAGALSHGNMQRLGLARAMLHDPQLVILDEPANGLDPAGIVEIRELLRTMAHEQGVTVFMSSHILAEVARVVDRVGIIHHGRLMRELDAAELEKERLRRLVVRTADLNAAAAALRGAWYDDVRVEQGMLILDGAETLAHPDQVALRLAEAGQPPRHLAVEEEDLESYFLRLINRPESAP